MIACYAQGGGLGHLTRIRAYLHTVHADEPATVLTASPFAADPRILGPHRLLSPPQGAAPARWLSAVLRDLSPRTFVVDAFPAGIDGELTAAVVPPGTRTVHLARLLRWDAYRRVLPADPVRYDRTWTVEDLTADHAVHLAAISGTVARLRLAEPDPGPGTHAEPQGAWLVVHAGPAAEVTELLAYARECAALEGAAPKLVLVAPRRPPDLPPDVRHQNPYPAWPLFAHAGRIISAAGCNVVRQVAPWHARHLLLPFPRRWDDQFLRAARARAASNSTSQAGVATVRRIRPGAGTETTDCPLSSP